MNKVKLKHVIHSLYMQIYFGIVILVYAFLKNNIPETVEQLPKFMADPRTIGTSYIFLAVNTYIHLIKSLKSE